jgi:hypothetical protein
MARRKSGIGLLGWIAVVILVLILVAYLQRHHIHWPSFHHSLGILTVPGRPAA